MEFLADKEGITVIVVGDFNDVLDKTIDRFPPGPQSDRVVEGRLPQFLMEVGLRDIWRTWNPKVQQYSCLSSSYATLSRLDMALGNEAALSLVKNVVYGPRGVSDHSPLVVMMYTGTSAHRGTGK